MSASTTDPTPYPEVNTVLNLLLSEVQAVLKEHFAGMYLYGSLASGDFDPERSDIDFVVVTEHELPDNLIRALEAIHMRLYTSGLKWATKLEGSYVPKAVLRRHNPAHPPCPTINEGRFYVDERGLDWIIQRHIIREYPVVLAGADPKTLIDPVQPDDLRFAVVGILRAWWAPMLENRNPWLHRAEYEAYAVLTMCRVLYTLETGIVASKPVSAQWAHTTLGEQWQELIEWALHWKHEDTQDHFSEALDFIRYTLDRSQQFNV